MSGAHAVAAIRRPLVRARADQELVVGSRARYEDGRLYDHVYRLRTRDVRFYVELARETAARSVLEIGFGTGRVGLAIAQAGISVFGLEPMASMLARARERLATIGLGPASAPAPASVTLHRGDVRSMRLGRRFPLVIGTFNVFQHLYTPADIAQGLGRVREHLAHSGRFAFDVMVPELGALAASDGRRYSLGHVSFGGRRYRYSETHHYDAVRQIRFIYMHHDDPAEPAASFTIPLAHRQFFPEELLGLLDRHGFEVLDRFGDFDRSPFEPRSEHQVLLCRRKT